EEQHAQWARCSKRHRIFAVESSKRLPMLVRQRHDSDLSRWHAFLLERGLRPRRVDHHPIGECAFLAPARPIFRRRPFPASSVNWTFIVQSCHNSVFWRTRVDLAKYRAPPADASQFKNL